MWALHKHFPNVKIYVRAHDVMHGLNLEKVRPCFWYAAPFAVSLRAGSE